MSFRNSEKGTQATSPASQPPAPQPPARVARDPWTSDFLPNYEEHVNVNLRNFEEADGHAQGRLWYPNTAAKQAEKRRKLKMWSLFGIFVMFIIIAVVTVGVVFWNEKSTRGTGEMDIFGSTVAIQGRRTETLGAASADSMVFVTLTVTQVVGETSESETSTSTGETVSVTLTEETTMSASPTTFTKKADESKITDVPTTTAQPTETSEDDEDDRRAPATTTKAFSFTFDPVVEDPTTTTETEEPTTTTTTESEESPTEGAEPPITSRIGGQMGWCSVPGMACLKRDLEEDEAVEEDRDFASILDKDPPIAAPSPFPSTLSTLVLRNLSAFNAKESLAKASTLT